MNVFVFLFRWPHLVLHLNLNQSLHIQRAEGAFGQLSYTTMRYVTSVFCIAVLC